MFENSDKNLSYHNELLESGFKIIRIGRMAKDGLIIGYSYEDEDILVLYLDNDSFVRYDRTSK